jgi:uncharacterized spore protein YtfJ
MNVLSQLSEAVGSTVTVKSVFGEPIRAEGRTVVPVARVRYAFGGGFGSGHGGEGEGGGGGGCVHAYPAGALEITACGTRFVPLLSIRVVAAALGVGALIGVWMGDRVIRTRAVAVRPIPR